MTSMRYDYVEQIKSRVTLSALISKSVQLKSKRAGQFLGLCPFHSEKTPSFTVNDAKRFYYCFGCSATGDVFTWLMETEGLTYKLALERLAGIAGVSLPLQREFSKDEIDAKNKEQICYNIFEEITKFYQQQLNQTAGEEARAYLRSRGLSKATVEKYRLGYAPNDSKKLEDLLYKNFTAEEIAESTIFGKSDTNKTKYETKFKDPFRGRVIFPICDRKQRVIAFGGRVISNQQFGPKYLNSSENPVFHKGEVLYGMHLAENAAYKAKEMIVVEGYMDVLALANNNFENAVAPLGTSLRVSHIEQLWRIVDNPIICFDTDNAGLNAAKRLAIEILKSITSGKSLRFILLSGAKDIDEAINHSKNHTNNIKGIINNTIPLADFLFNMESKEWNLKIPESRISFKNRLMEFASKISESALASEYKRHFLNLLFQSRDIGVKKKPDLIDSENQSRRMKSLMKKENHHILIALRVLLRFRELLDEQEIYEEFVNLEAPNVLFFYEMRSYILGLWDGSLNFTEEHIAEKYGDFIDCIDTYADNSLDESRKTLLRAFRLHTISVLEEQIREAEKDVLENQTEASQARLWQLISYKEWYKRDLKIY